MPPQQNHPPRNHFSLPTGKPGPCQALVGHARLPNDHDDGLRRSGAVDLQIETLQPLHIGCGDFTLGADGQAVKEIARHRGTPIIPGSSLKGACRQVFELLTGSPPALGDRPRRGDPVSPAAGLFGYLGYQGRASFDDAISIEPIEVDRIKISVAYEPKHSPRGKYKFYGDLPPQAYQPRSIPAYVVPRGARFTTKLRLRNVTDEEIGGLLLSLGVGHFSPRLGGAKYDALGMVRVSVSAFRLGRGLGSAPDVESDADRAATRAAAWIAAFQPTPEGTLPLGTLRARQPLPGGQGSKP